MWSCQKLEWTLGNTELQIDGCNVYKAWAVWDAEGEGPRTIRQSVSICDSVI